MIVSQFNTIDAIDIALQALEGFDLVDRMTTPLCDIMTKYGSDKGDNRHNYTNIYHPLFEKFRNTPLQILEVGLGTNNVDLPSNMGADGKPGASLFAWSEYFHNAIIYGADLDPTIVVDEGRIKTFWVDQTENRSFEEMLERIDGKFDLIMDDALHRMFANVSMFVSTYHRLKHGGIYIIEDVGVDEVPRFKNFLTELDKANLARFVIIDLPHHWNKFDNRMIVLQKPLEKLREYVPQRKADAKD